MNMNNCFKRNGTRHLHSWGKLAFNVFLFGSENEGTIVSSLRYSLTHSLITAVHKYKLQRFTFLSFCLLILCSAGSMGLLAESQTSNEI